MSKRDVKGTLNGQVSTTYKNAIDKTRTPKRRNKHEAQIRKKQ
jgi:hypothetical protein